MRLPILLCLLLCGFLSGTPVQGSVSEERVPLSPEMVINETGVGDASLLVDEQQVIGDPASGRGNRPEHPFFPGWQKDLYPVHVLIDLGTVRHVTRVFLYNESGESPVTLSTGQPFAWKPQPVHQTGYRAWCAFPLDTRSRYLRITLTQPASLPEIALYADSVASLKQPVVSPLPKQPRLSPVTMDHFIGANAFIDDPIEQLAAAVGFVREYHPWSWDTEAPDHQVRFQPSGAAGGNSWFFDDFYGKLASSGVTVCPAIQQTSATYFPGDDPDAKPVAKGDDAEQPQFYRVHAGHLFQYAARYGQTRVPDTLLTLGENQPRKSGLGYLRYIENWNEPDKNWRGRAGRFTPYELAALCSADYDGDQGRMGKTVGVKNADPRIKLVMGGLAGIRLDYLKAMKLWADFHRGGDFPADVINLHHYSNDGDDNQPFRTTGISPEADHLRERMEKIVTWRNATLPKCELWLTEFGYDTNPKSPFHAPALGSYTAEEVQGFWLIRSYLALAAAGVDRVAMFMFRDVKSDDGGVFATSGMVTEKGQWKPKPSYYYIATLKRRLSGMHFAGEVPSGRKEVLVYRFVGATGKAAYVVWCPTSNDTTVTDFALPIKARAATLVEFTDGQLAGKASSLPIASGKVRLTVREKPILVLSP